MHLDNLNLSIYLVAFLSLLFSLMIGQFLYKSDTSNSLDLAFPVMASFMLITDSTFVIINRVLKGKTPFNPGKTHLHHKFLNLNFRNRYIVIMFIAGAILYSILTFFVQNIGFFLFIFLLILINIIFVILPCFLPPLFKNYNL